jgi:putative CocE/NonD family hydrolase
MLRKAYVKPEMMKPGEVYPITIELFATSNLFKKGHRIRVDVSSSDYPDYDPNPNTGQLYMSGHTGIYHDKEHPSHIILPIIPIKQGQ